MRLLAEIDRHQGVNRKGKAVTREAVRAIVIRNGSILLLYSRREGDYHFPGGGVDAGETHLEALSRELREECGAELTQVHEPFGKIVEYAFPKEHGFDVFRMTSYYYICSIGDELGPQGLTGYERDLGLEPHWTTVERALEANEAVLASRAPAWTMRETTVLRLLTNTLAHAAGK
ncbi:MAG TPA: NUDIX domain-containing protein [Firmicutes bacterium]|nr:NUDIX domain-containing protein [Bacillota bacterium]HHT43592.1 NUDIX domain-containing protein [Bacillota bacterium]